MLRKIISLLCTLLILCGILCSCNEKTDTGRSLKKYALPDSVNLCDSQNVAENDSFLLSFDNGENIITLRDKRTGAVWSSTPADFNKGDADVNAYQLNALCSMLTVTYMDAGDRLVKEISSYEGAVCNGYVESKLVKNGICITFYFDEQEFEIPVYYTLNENGLSAKIKLNKIKEGANLLYKISLLPFCVSAKNNTDSYLFVPSGNGAIMNVDSGVREIRYYNEEVYGNDLLSQEVFSDTKSETVRMPVFGAKNKQNGIIGVISQGAELASINAVAGDSQYGYSGVYPTFSLRGCKNETVDSVGGTNAEISTYSGVTSGVSEFEVDYIPIEDDASYNGMAKAYRNYLISKNKVKKDYSECVAALDFLGGEKVNNFIFGVPHTSVKSATSFSDAQKILKDILSNTNASLNVRLRGFGENGLGAGKFAEGLIPASVFGGRKAFNRLCDWCRQNKINIALDADTVFFNKSGNGVSVKKAAIGVNDTRAKYYYYNIVTNKQDSESDVAYMVGRYDLALSSLRLISMLKKSDVQAVSLSTLSSCAYSDYRKGVYIAKSNMGKDVCHIFDKLSSAGYFIMSDSANDYAAVSSDFIYNAPYASSRLNAFDEEIPFYHIVFRGITPMSCQSVNLSNNPKQAFLRAMSLGASLGFTLINEYNTGFRGSVHTELAYSVYEDIEDDVKSYINQAKPLIDNLKDSAIRSYKKDGELSTTVFENGTVVCVNFGKKPIDSVVGKVEPFSMKYKFI